MEAGVAIDKITPDLQTTYRIGAVYKNVTVTDRDNKVSVDEINGHDSDWIYSYARQTSSYPATGTPTILSEMTFAGVSGAYEAHFRTGLKSPVFIIGARLAAGVVVSDIKNDDIRYSGVSQRGPYTNGPLPPNSSHHMVAISPGLTAGLDQKTYIPGLKLDVDAAFAKHNTPEGVIFNYNNTSALNVELSAFKSIPLGKDGFELDLQAGINLLKTNAQHENGLMPNPQPNDPRETASAYNGSQTHGLGPNVKIGLKIPLGHKKPTIGG